MKSVYQRLLALLLVILQLVTIVPTSAFAGTESSISSTTVFATSFTGVKFEVHDYYYVVINNGEWYSWIRLNDERLSKNGSTTLELFDTFYKMDGSSSISAEEIENTFFTVEIMRLANEPTTYPSEKDIIEKIEAGQDGVVDGKYKISIQRMRGSGSNISIDPYATHVIDYSTVLGNGVYYGITSKYLNQTGDLQSNFATNYYNGNGQHVSPNLSGSSGVIVMANAAQQGMQNQGQPPVEYPYYLKIGEGNSQDSQLVVYYGSQLGEYPVMDTKGFVYPVAQDQTTLETSVVNPIINHMKNISSSLSNHTATISPTVTSGRIDIDTTLDSFDDDATIFIDMDSSCVEALKTPDSLYINKKKNQVIVFNFRTTADESVKLSYIHVKYPGEDEIITTTPKETGNPHNDKINHISQTLVFNFINTKRVDVGAVAGMFLLPAENAEFETSLGTSAGWVICNGKVTVSTGEWHNVFKEQPSSTTINFTALKTVEGSLAKTGEVFNFVLEKVTPDSLLKNNWTVKQVATTTNVKGTVAFNKISTEGLNLQKGWNVFRIRETGLATGTENAYNIDNEHVYAFVYCKIMGNTQVGYRTICSPALYYKVTTDYLSQDTVYLDYTFNKDASTLSNAFSEGSIWWGEALQPITEEAPAFNNTEKQLKGALKIKKVVSINNNPTDTTFVDGDYEFTVQGTANISSTKHTVVITIKNGTVYNAKIDGVSVNPDNEGYAVVQDLPLGKYNISEKITDDMKAKGISLIDPRTNNKEITIKRQNVATIQSAVFKNNRDGGNLKVEKELIGNVEGNNDKLFKITVKNSENKYLQSDKKSFGTDPYEFSLSVNNPFTANNLPIDTYTVEEKTGTGYTDIIDNYLWIQTGSITTGTGTTEKNKTKIITLKNKYYHEEKAGSFEFGKQIEGRAFNGSDEFTFVISTSDTGAPMPTEATKVGDEYQIKLKPAANETDATVVVGNFEFETADFDSVTARRSWSTTTQSPKKILRLRECRTTTRKPSLRR